MWLVVTTVGAINQCGMGNTYDANDVVIPIVFSLFQSIPLYLVPLNATYGAMEFFAPLNSTWYHIVIEMAPTSVIGQVYGISIVNGQKVRIATRLTHTNATFTTTARSQLPQAVTRSLSYLGKSALSARWRNHSHHRCIQSVRLSPLTQPLSQHWLEHMASTYPHQSHPPTPRPAVAETSAFSLSQLASQAPIFNANFANHFPLPTQHSIHELHLGCFRPLLTRPLLQSSPPGL